MTEASLATEPENALQFSFRPIFSIAPLVVLLVLLSKILHAPETINHDCACVLQIAELMLKGRTLYVDVIDLNPPLVFYISLIPAFLAGTFHLSDILTFKIFVWILTACSEALSILILARAKTHRESRFFAPLLFSFAFLQLILIGHLGQREQLIVLGLFPFILLRWLNHSGQRVDGRLAGITGFLAGISCCLKPQSFLIPFSIELFYLFRRRRPKVWWAPELFSMLAAVVIYGMHFLFLPDSELKCFFGDLLPLTARGYGAYNAEIIDLFMISGISGSFMPHRLVLLAVALLSYWRRKDCSLFAPFLITQLAGYTIYLAAGKGFIYQAIPMFFGYFAAANLLLSLLAFWLFGHLRKRLASLTVDQISFIGFSACLIALLPASLIMARNTEYTSQAFDRCNKLVIEKTGPASNVLILGSAVVPAYPCLLETHRMPASRQITLFPLAALEFLRRHEKQEQSAKKISALEDSILRGLAADLARSKPELIMVDYALHQGQFNSLQFLSQRNFLNSSLTGFHEAGTYNGCAVWLPDGNDRKEVR